MAYFKQNEQEETRRTGVLNPEEEYRPDDDVPETYGDEEYDGYDDGFDDPEEDEYEEELTDEEKADIRKNRLKILFGAGNLTAVIIGAIVILLLLALLFSIINFVKTDFVRNFTLFQTKI